MSKGVHVSHCTHFLYFFVCKMILMCENDAHFQVKGFKKQKTVNKCGQGQGQGGKGAGQQARNSYSCNAATRYSCTAVANHE
jgi:hypothetical protein